MTELPAPVKKVGVLTSIIVGILTIVILAITPYKEFSDFKYRSVEDRKELWDRVVSIDSTINIWMSLTRENNYNLREYFENGQPKNYKWKSEAEILQEMQRKFPK